MKKEHLPFQLNFTSPSKVVTITLADSDGIFAVADLFKKLLDEAGIECTKTEKLIEDAEQIS